MVKDVVLQAIEQWFSDPLNIKQFEENLEREERRIKRYTDKLHSLSQEQFDEFVQKCINKYESDSYKDKEWSKCREPLCNLYDIIFSCAEFHGEHIDTNEDFLAERLRYRGWIIDLYIGQGSFYRIYKDE